MEYTQTDIFPIPKKWAEKSEAKIVFVLWKMCKLNLILRAHIIWRVNIWLLTMRFCGVVKGIFYRSLWSDPFNESRLISDGERRTRLRRYQREWKFLFNCTTRNHLIIFMLGFMTHSANIAHQKRLLRAENRKQICGSALDDDDDTTHSERRKLITDNTLEVHTKILFSFLHCNCDFEYVFRLP